MIKNCKQQPLVPIGTFLTCGALALSVRASRRGNSFQANRMFVWRIVLQGLTVVALVGGSWYLGLDEKWKKGREDELRQKAEIREKMWIEELERIDQDARERQERSRRFREAKAKMEAESKSDE